MNLTVENINIHFQVYGNGPPLIILHGWGDNGSNWYRVAQALESKFQVFLIDLPGCGYSESPPSVWGVEDYQRLLESFIREMEIKEPIILGHSHGGKIAALHASMHKPCKKLILISSSGLDRKSIKVRAKVYYFKFMKQILSLCGTWGKEKLQKLREKLGSRDYREAGELRQTMVKVVNQKLFSVIRSISVPTLILWGSEDKALDLTQAKIFRRLIAGSQIRVLWGATHHPHLEVPGEIAELVSEFCVSQ